MAGHTFIAKAKSLFARLFSRKSAKPRAQGIPLHVLDGVCCTLSKADLEAQDYLYRLRLQGKYKKPRPLAGYLCDEQGITLLEYNTRKRDELKKREHAFDLCSRRAGMLT